MSDGKRCFRCPNGNCDDCPATAVCPDAHAKRQMWQLGHAYPGDAIDPVPEIAPIWHEAWSKIKWEDML